MPWPCVCPFIRQKSVGWSDRTHFDTGTTSGLSLCRMEIWVSPKIRVASLRKFVPNSPIAKISPRHVDHQLSSPDDCRQLITSSIHVCVQHDAVALGVARDGSRDLFANKTPTIVLISAPSLMTNCVTVQANYVCMLWDRWIARRGASQEKLGSNPARQKFRHDQWTNICMYICLRLGYL